MIFKTLELSSANLDFHKNSGRCLIPGTVVHEEDG